MLSDVLENKPEYLYEQIKKTASGYSSSIPVSVHM